MNRKGFTLIELMIIISIIGILAAVAIPTFAQLVDHSKKSAANRPVAVITQYAQDGSKINEWEAKYYFFRSNGVEVKTMSGNTVIVSGNYVIKE